MIRLRVPTSNARSLALLLAACSQPDADLTPPDPTDLHVVSSGRTLALIGLLDDEIAHVDSAEVPGDGLHPNHKVFGAVMHPSESWLYVTSFDFYARGNARIDRFAVAEDGSLAFITEGGNRGAHGLAIGPTGTYV